MARQTVVVSSHSSFDAVRLELARYGTGSGVRVVPVEEAAARLAGGFSAPVDPEALNLAISAALAATTSEDLGDLEAIRSFPGFPRTLATTLRRVWSAGLDLEEQAHRNPRLAALVRIEAAVLGRLPPGQVRPMDLVNKAIERLPHAPAVLGPVEVRGVPDLPCCWRPLLLALADVVPVTWTAGLFPVPPWVSQTRVSVRSSGRKHPVVKTMSCANPRHEVVEAMRWARSLIASGTAGPHQIAFAAASTSPYDDFLFSLSEECLLKLCYGHGRSALHTPEGQATAALADVLLRGLSQERIRRVMSHAATLGAPELASLPKGWSRLLPASAPLGTPEHWCRALDGEEKKDAAKVILPIVDLLARGPGAAPEAGDRLLRGAARTLWRRALTQAPATALDRELATLRVNEPNDQATSIAWMPASSLASTPRPFVWLLGLNAQSWPRPSTEDPLLPQRMLGDLKLEEVTISAADRTSFDAIMASSECEVVRSFSRREAGSRRLGVSPLVAGQETEVLYRTQTPRHAMSEPDRQMARPEEFAARGDAKLADKCWRAWRNQEITEHDGLIKREHHPAIEAALKRPQSAHSLTLLLRNPIGFMWVHGLGMHAPELDGDTLEMDARSFGILVHEVLDAVIRDRSPADDDIAWTSDALRLSVADRMAEARARWEVERPIPPRMLWESILAKAERMVLNGLLYPFDKLPAQRSYSEVLFGSSKASGGRPMPWDINVSVPIPHTGLTITGCIDRVDIAGDGSAARVIDYKTGNSPGDVVLRGGRELQRCLYAYAVQTLLGDGVVTEAGLLHPSREAGSPEMGAYDVLPDPHATLERLAKGLAAAEVNLRRGLALPGVGAGARYKDVQNSKDNACHEQDDLAFALPVVPGTMLGPKKTAARQMLGTTITEFWEVR